MATSAWKVRTLGELTENYDSVRVPVKGADRTPGPFPYYGASGIVDYVGGYLFDGAYLLIAEDGENLRTRQTPVAFLANGKFWVNNHAHIVRGNGHANTKFLMYALANTDISGYLSGSTMPKLTQGNMNRIPILTPPRPLQDRIANILGALDDKIDLNQRTNETLEAMAHTLFKSWFIDFDPVRAKAEGRKPHGMDPATAALFPDRFEDSPLGKIPKGWNVVSFSDAVEIISGGTPKTSVADFWNGDIPWFSVVDTPSRSEIFAIDTAKRITTLGLNSSSTTLLQIGTTIISARGTVGNLAIVGVPMAMNQSCYGLKKKKGSTPFFTYFSICGLVATLRQRTHGSIFDTITRDTFASVQTVAVPDELASRFDAVVDSLMRQILNNRQESRTLAAMRDALLPRLLSGDLHPNEICHVN